MRKPILFISGPMTNLPNKNRDNFNFVASYAEDIGFIVLNPSTLPDGLRFSSYMPICLAMLNGADFLFALPDSNTVGALTEQNFAHSQGIPIIHSLQELEETYHAYMAE